MAEITPQRVQRWLIEGCKREAGIGSVKCFAQGPLAIRDNSRLFYAECTGFPSPLAVKVCLQPHTDQTDPNSAQRQYDALLRVSRAMGYGTEFSVPQPYLVREDVGMLVSEWISGANMTDLVCSWRCNSAQAHEYMMRGARWLRCFHACHQLARDRLHLAEKLNFIVEMESAGYVADPVFSRSLTCLKEFAEAAAAVTLEQSWLHGDFKTDNLLISGRRTVGIDVHLRHEGAVIYDLALFLNHLELRLCHPSSWRLASSHAQLRNTFLTSYLQDHRDRMAAPLAWVQLYMILAEWCTAQAHASSSWLRSSFVNICYRRVAARLASRIQGTH